MSSEGGERPGVVSSSEPVWRAGQSYGPRHEANDAASRIAVPPGIAGRGGRLWVATWSYQPVEKLMSEFMRHGVERLG